MLCLENIDEFCGISLALGDNVIYRRAERCLDRRGLLGITLDKVSDYADDKALYVLV